MPTDFEQNLAARMLDGARSAVASVEDQSLSSRHSHLVGWLLGHLDEGDRKKIEIILRLNTTLEDDHAD